MRTLAFALLAACGSLFTSSTLSANQGPPPKGTTKGLTPAPPPKPADPTMPLAGLGAAAGAVALGAWFLRRGATRPGG